VVKGESICEISKNCAWWRSGKRRMRWWKGCASAGAFVRVTEGIAAHGGEKTIDEE